MTTTRSAKVDTIIDDKLKASTVNAIMKRLMTMEISSSEELLSDTCDDENYRDDNGEVEVGAGRELDIADDVLEAVEKAIAAQFSRWTNVVDGKDISKKAVYSSIWTTDEISRRISKMGISSSQPQEPESIIDDEVAALVMRIVNPQHF